jgi:uncharacterized protein
MLGIAIDHSWGTTHTIPQYNHLDRRMSFELPQKEIAAFCRRWGIVRLEVFGSVIRDDFRPDSDIDFLYTPGPNFRPDRAFGPWPSSKMADELSALLGRKVDLIERRKMESHRNWIRREHVLKSARSIYVER